MTYLTFTEVTILVVFILLAIILILLIAFFVSFPFILKRYTKKNYVKSYGRKIYKLALHNDYYLINRLPLKTMDGSNIDIDHLLCGNKFIYVINDAYIDGELYAKINDRTWIKSTKIKKQIQKQKIENLLLVNKKRIETFSSITNLSQSLIINIVLINDDCKLEGFENTSKNAFLVHVSSFKKLLMTFERSNVANLKDNQLRRAVEDIAQLNERKKNERR